MSADEKLSGAFNQTSEEITEDIEEAIESEQKTSDIETDIDEAKGWK